jgi:hypothetical protein
MKMQIEESVMFTEAFDKAFWEWFDYMPERERKVFLYYKEDAARLYFLNKYYSKRHAVKANENSGYLIIRT